MKLMTTDFRRKCQFPVMLALAALPLHTFLSAQTVPETMKLLWLMPTAYVLLAWLCLVIPGRKRLIAGAVGFVGLMALGVTVLPYEESWPLLLGPLMYGVLLLWGLQFSGWRHDQEFNYGWYVTGMLTNAFLQIMINTAHKMNNPVYDHVETPIMICFLAYLALVLLSMNRTSMDSASMGRQRIPVHMRRRNVALTMGFLVLVVLIAAAPAVIAAVETAWDWLMRAVLWLLDMIGRMLPESGGGGGGGGGMEAFSAGEAVEQSWLAQFLEKVAVVVAAAIGTALAIFALRVLYKKLKILVKYLWNRLTEYAANASEDYEDEVTDTRADGERERINFLERLKKRMAFVDEKKLTPAQRIRYRYLRLMVKHEDWSAGQTARESLPVEAAQLYERARYSDHPVTESDADKFTSDIKNV